MLGSMLKLILDKADDDKGGGGAPDSAEKQPPPAADDKTAKEGGDNVDDFGYEKTPEAPADKKPADKKPDDKPAEEVKAPATGYEAEPKPIEEEKPVDPPAVEVPDELDPLLKDLPKDESGRIKDFAKKNGLSKEQVTAYADVRKKEFADAKVAQAKYEKDMENAKLKVRADWHAELKSDAVFGGEKFQHSVSRVNKVLEEFMPQTKKALTDNSGMLPPYVMRDLAKLADHLYPVEKLVTGDPASEGEKEEKDSPLDFYKT